MTNKINLVKIHWRMLILECSQGLWRTDGSVTISPRNFVGEGIIKIQYFKNFKKLQNFHKISKLTYFIRFQKIKKKIQNFHRIWRKFSKFQNLYIMNLIFFLKIGFAEIPYINNGLLVYLVFSMSMGVNISWVGGVDIPMVYRHPYPIQLLTFNAVYSWPGPHSHE
jgi:hypothetical protein